MSNNSYPAFNLLYSTILAEYNLAQADLFKVAKLFSTHYGRSAEALSQPAFPEVIPAGEGDSQDGDEANPGPLHSRYSFIAELVPTLFRWTCLLLEEDIDLLAFYTTMNKLCRRTTTSTLEDTM